MSRYRLLFMVGVLTVVVIAAFAMPAIANEDMMGGETGDNSSSTNQQPETNTITNQTGIDNNVVSCWQYSDVFERWDWDCD
jgi:hypothetical protein